MLDIWSVKTGHDLGQYSERDTVTIPLPTKPNVTNVKYKLISGKIPPGLRLNDASLIGTPLEVPRILEFEFCIRAEKNNEISDRTFKIRIEGSDEPEILTNPGLLPVGPNQTFYILDSSPVEFQLTAADFDTAAGQKLKFFINPGDGGLPPGVRLTRDGLITGVVEPLLAIPVKDRDGGFDDENYDNYGYDFGILSDNGFDSFNFDMVSYDFSAPIRGVRKLNRNYEFFVTVTDGDSYTKRKFRIYVVGEDYLRADNTILKAGTNTYKASASSLRTPIWMTPMNLGTIRANNYHILKLDIYEANSYGAIQYYHNATNPDNSPSILPPGMTLDIVNGEVFGLIPYQSEIIKTYNFTITVTRFGKGTEKAEVPRTFSIKILGEVNSNMSWLTPSTLGSIDANYTSTLKIVATSNLTNPNIQYRIMQGVLPPGLTLLDNGEIVGKIRQYSTNNQDGLTTFSDGLFTNQTFDGGETSVDKTYKFVVRASDQTNYSSIDQEFILDIKTPNDRLYSNLFVTAYMDIDKRRTFDSFINNSDIFPESLIYRFNDPNFGVRKDMRILIYGGIETVNVEQYISMIGLNHKRKRLHFGDLKYAKAKDPETNEVIYEVVYVEMVDPQDQSDKHLPLKLTNLNPASKVTSADMSNWVWRTQGMDIYTSGKEPFAPRPIEYITIDQTNIQVSDYNQKNRYPNSVYNWRKRIRYYLDPNGNELLTERNYLPLWMRSYQDDKKEIGFTLALPLCYCKPNKTEDILLNIKNYRQQYNFDFKDFDYTVDRYIIDSVAGYGNDKYLVFKNQEATV